MKFTLNWLKTYLESDASLKEITDKLTAIGLELEGVEDATLKLAPFTIAHVVEAVQHPNADRLRICKVDTGNGIFQVVCGAPNAKTGMYGVFAPVGSYVPGIDLTLKAGVLRGEESNGMLVSEREMQLSDEHDGIIELSDGAGKIGQSFAKYAGLDDPIIEIAITPNRGDCLGVYGIARDLAAAGLGKLKQLNYDNVKGGFDSPINWNIADDVKDNCPFVVGRYIKNVKNCASPKWMQDRLRAIGLRPISALVDITNYITHDLGRPLHVFDGDKISGDLTIHYGKDNDKLTALDGNQYDISGNMLVISDDQSVQSIAGIMGGEDSGVNENTCNVFVESALWHPINIAETGRLLGIESDARYRFERGIDPTSALWGEMIASKLILEICGGDASNITTAGQEPKWQRQASLRVNRIKSHGGVDIKTQFADDILQKLGFKTNIVNDAKAGDIINVDIPSWRNDIEGEHCLMEEILRIYGFENIPTISLIRDSALPKVAISTGQRRVAFAKKILAQNGMYEMVSWSFTSEKQANLFGGGAKDLHISNPISSDLSVMRPGIIGNLIAAAVRNAGRGYNDIALFEVGPAYRAPNHDGQDTVAAGIHIGKNAPRHWTNSARHVDLFDAKANILAVIAACAPTLNLQISDDAPTWYHTGRSGSFKLGKNTIAYFGELHPKILKEMGMKDRAIGFEIFMDNIPQPKSGAKSKSGKTRKALQMSNFQAVNRDFSFVVNDNINADKIIRAAEMADKKLITNVDIFDIYKGDKLIDQAGDEMITKKSIAINITIQAQDKTLNDKEIEAITAKVIANVAKLTGGILRS